MKKLWTCVLALNLMTGLAACTDDFATPQTPDLTVYPNTAPTPGPTAKPTEETNFDYNLLMFEHKGVCGSKEFSDRFVNIDNVKIGVTSDGKDILVGVELLIYPSGWYEAEYKEMDIESYTESGYTYKRHRTRYLKGSWSKEKDRLILQNLGVLQGTLADKKILASFEYTNDILTLGLKNRGTSATRVSSYTAIKNYREVCVETDTTPGAFAQFFSRGSQFDLNLRSLHVSPLQSILSGSFLVTEMEIFLQKNGANHLIFKVRNLSDGVEKTFSYDFPWESARGQLDLNYGHLSFVGTSADVVLQFDRDIDLYEGTTPITRLNLKGKIVRLNLQKSSYTIDDLTSNSFANALLVYGY